MVHIKQLDDTNIYKFWIDDQIDQESMLEFHKVIQQRVKDHQKVRLLGVVHTISGFKDLKALRETISMKLDAIHGVEKYAVLTDLDWVESMLPIVDFFTPDMPVKSFEEDEEEEAIAWLKSNDTVEAHKRIRVERIPDTSIYTFTIDGMIDEQGVLEMNKLLKEKSKEGRMKVLGVLKDFDGLEHARTLLKGLQVNLAAIQNIEKYAVLTDEDWISNLMKIGDWLPLGMSMRAFEHDEREKAIEWLQGKEAGYSEL